MNKKYDPKFKQEAINLALNSEQTYRQTANDLGINYKTFCNWMYQTMNKPTHQAIKLNKKPDYQELERMQKGLAPIGKDGQSVNLHHMTQKQDGPIAEVTQNFHKDSHSVIHVNDNSIPSGIDRNQFNKWRSEYWKNRADEFKK